jgi:hypothetical protein
MAWPGISRRSGPTDRRHQAAPSAYLIRSVSTSRQPRAAHRRHHLRRWASSRSRPPRSACRRRPARTPQPSARQGPRDQAEVLASTVEFQGRGLEHLGEICAAASGRTRSSSSAATSTAGIPAGRHRRRHGCGHHHGRRQADRRPADAAQAHHPRGDVRLGRERRFVSDAYIAAHKAEVSRIVLAGESDLGADAIYALKLPAGFAADPRLSPRGGQRPGPAEDLRLAPRWPTAGADVAGLVRPACRPSSWSRTPAATSTAPLGRATP